MYEAFYSLRELPFRLTPDPDYLYLSAHHREALGHLLYGIREGSGFVAVTGEIGTGKTTLLRTLLRDLEPDTTVAYLFNPALSDVELLQTINSELGLTASSSSKKELVDELNRFLVAQKLAGKRVVVIVDEAQDLLPATLEQLRLLSNLETETEKLLQIVLVGQPELRAMLRRSDLAQLNQRITVRWHLEPLDRQETERYVRHRLRVAGGSPASEILTRGALRRIYRFSGGVPRLVNIAAHRALLAGYASERRTVDHRTAARALGELYTDEGLPRRRSALRPALTAVGAALVVGAAASLALLSPGLRPAPELASRSLPQPAEPERSPGDLDPSGLASATLASAKDPSLGADPAPSRDAGLASEHQTTPADVSAASTAPAVAAAAVTESPSNPALPPSPVAMDQGAGEHLTALWSALATMDGRTAAVVATAQLLAAWNTEPLRPEERSGARLDLSAIASRRGLRYLPTSGTLARFELLDLPAILELSLPETGQRRFVLMAGISDAGPLVRWNDDDTVLPARDLQGVWLGEAHLFWRDFENLSPYLAPGASGREIARLQRLLAGVGEYPDPPSLVYDPVTTEAIARFQRSRHLVPDGIVGPLTKILLYNAIADYDHPRLSGGT